MKLIKVKTKLTSSELVSIFENCSIEELEVILNMSKYFDYVDVDYSDKKSGFFAIMADSYKQRIEDFFQKHCRLPFRKIKKQLSDIRRY